MQVTYKGPSADIEIPDGQVATPGDTVTVDDELGDALIDSGDWVAAKSKKSTTPSEDDPK